MAALDFIMAKYMNCNISEIYEKVQDSMTRADVTNHLNGRKVITTYRNKEGLFKEFKLADITITSASDTYAYNGFMKTTVEQHFYTKHGIKIHRPYNPCAVEICGKSMQHRNYYPLETIRVDCVELNEHHIRNLRRYIQYTPNRYQRRRDSPFPSRRHFLTNRLHFSSNRHHYPNTSKYFETKNDEQQKEEECDKVDYDKDELNWLFEKEEAGEDNEKMEE